MWSIAWWLFLLLLGCLFIVGWIVCFFVMRKNPKYFGIDRMLKSKRDELLGLGKAKLLELQVKIADAVRNAS